jgi:hypothetical protein
MNKLNYHLYFGKAGHLFVMSEFLLRGWNVAIPEVDEGDDIFVVKHEEGRLMRIQVKTSQAKLQRENFTATFSISTRQLDDATKDDIFYIFLVRNKDKWELPLIISRYDLFETLIGIRGNKSIENQTIRFSFKNRKIHLKDIDLTKYQNNFTDFET